MFLFLQNSKIISTKRDWSQLGRNNKNLVQVALSRLVGSPTKHDGSCEFATKRDRANKFLAKRDRALVLSRLVATKPG